MATGSGYFDNPFTRGQIENKYKLAAFDRDMAAKYGYGYGTNSSAPNTTFGSGGSGSSSTATSGLFGNLGGYVDQAKDLARFRLGLDQEQARFSRGLREEESQADFGRNYKLAEQQIIGQKDLTNLQQSATTERLEKQLDSQQLMQTRGFDQQNLYRAQSAALALRGLR